jgi:hypothetical protein
VEQQQIGVGGARLPAPRTLEHVVDVEDGTHELAFSKVHHGERTGCAAAKTVAAARVARKPKTADALTTRPDPEKRDPRRVARRL